MSRILWVSTETPDRYGQGGQRRQYHQIRELVARGHDVEVLTLRNDQDDTSLRALVPVRRVRVAWRRWSLSENVRRMRNRIGRSECDVVVVSHVESWWMLPEPFSLTVPVVLDVHNALSHWYSARGLRDEAESARELEAIAFADAAAVMTCSALERDRVVDAHPDTTGKTIIAPIGIDPDEWPERTFPPAEPTVALFGTWSWHPNSLGLDWFARDVWPRVIEKEPAAKALVAGSGVTGEAEWPAGMTFVGRVPDIGDFTASAAVVAVPVIEGVGASMKFPEALMSGAPVLATTDGANGVATSPAFVSDDADQWAGYIVARIRDRALAPRPNEARQFALEHLTWAKTVAPLDDWIREQAGQRAPVRFQE